jgi:phenylpyruvate tautomerase PptA (4-oxalocrotonate tautomerase family)
MPYIAINTSAALSPVQREKVKAELGRLISIIPGKAEADLMVDIFDGRKMYMGGAAVPAAYIDLRVYTKADAEAKKRFTKETFALLIRELGVKQENLYMTITEFENWGYGGEFHSTT